MKITDPFLTAIAVCSDAVYVIEEDTKKIVWLQGNDSRLQYDPAEGQPCWKVLLDRDKLCTFCPKLNENERYSWDFYDRSRKLWYKISNLLITKDNNAYRIGIINIIDDIMRLNQDSVQNISELEKLLCENRRIKDAFEHEANHDRMTGLFNRNRYRIDISSGIYDCGQLGILYLDLNNLKMVNDTYRHEAGDHLIMRLAAAITQITAASADYEGYRVGGDEFVIFAKNMSPEKLQQVKKDFYATLASLNEGHALMCSVAVGTAFCEEPCDVEQLVKKADNNMYTVKKEMKEKNKNSTVSRKL